jgi:hypothetical protein
MLTTAATTATAMVADYRRPPSSRSSKNNSYITDKGGIRHMTNQLIHKSIRHHKGEGFNTSQSTQPQIDSYNIERGERRPGGGESGDATEQDELGLTPEAAPLVAPTLDLRRQCERENREGEIAGERKSEKRESTMIRR